MVRRKIACLFCSLMVLVIISASGCNQNAPASEGDEDTTVITPVTVTPVNYGPVTERIDLPAVTAYLNKSIVRSTTTGTVESISITVGDVVRKDQLLYTIKTREATALNNSLKGDSTFSFNGKIDIISTKEGVISTVSHQNGDFVQEGDELAVISDKVSLVFILNTPFEFVKYVEQARNCKIHLPDNNIIDGSISGRLPEMDTQAQTVRYMVRSSFLGHLPANLNAVVSIVKSTRNKAAKLPKDAVLGNETQTEFWIMKLIDDSTAIKVPVTKGFEDSEEVEITAPELIKSDRIVLTGGYGLPDTARIIIK